jgi:diguanylate cyclase (GGDEF)-like protein
MSDGGRGNGRRRGGKRENPFRDTQATHTEPISVVPLSSDDDLVPCLIVIAGPDLGQMHPVSHRVRVGRAKDAEMSISDNSISRYHAAVQRLENGDIHLTDLDSTNGTFVNGKQVDEATLRGGDRIQLGVKTVVKLDFLGKIEGDFHHQLYEAGTRDPLTGLFNRRYLEQHLETDFRLALRHDEQLSVMVLDLDHFKSINDRYGHLAGDMVLRSFASILARRCRREDIIARYGGEEFVVLLRRTSSEGAGAVAESVRSLVEEHTLSYQGKSIAVTVSIGVATLGPGIVPDDPLSLLKTADSALYRAKAEGRNCVVHRVLGAEDGESE